VLFAAACHAAWNASIKRTLDPLATTVLIAVGAGLVALPGIAWSGLPAPASWPWLIASIIIHIFYFAGLIESYRTGDLGQVYPIARGAAPLMTATMTTAFLGEHLGVAGWSGIVLLALGVLLLSLRGGRDLAKIDRTAVGFALFTAVSICAYSVVDGIGVRAAGPGRASAYSLVLFVGIAPTAISTVVASGSSVRLMLAFQAAWQAAANSTARKTKRSISVPRPCPHDSVPPACGRSRAPLAATPARRRRIAPWR